MSQSVFGLNRTFYGIETEIPLDDNFMCQVLIVPFMELKLIKFIDSVQNVWS